MVKKAIPKLIRSRLFLLTLIPYREMYSIEVMHKMTHQKAKAKEKWGAIPMFPDTIRFSIRIFT